MDGQSRQAVMPDERTLRRERAQLLIAQLREEHGGDHGWQAYVTRKLGVSEATVRRIMSGTRGAGGHVIDKFMLTLGLDRRFFTDPSLTNPHYTDFVRTPLMTGRHPVVRRAPEGGEPLPATAQIAPQAATVALAFMDFVETFAFPDMGTVELRQLAQLGRKHGWDTAGHYCNATLALRRGEPVEDAVDSATVMTEIERRRKELGYRRASRGELRAAVSEGIAEAADLERAAPMQDDALHEVKLGGG